MKVELLKRAYTREGKETGYLVGTRAVLWDDKTTGTAGVRSARTLVVVRTLISQIDDNGRLREVLIECLMDRCQ